MRTPRWIAAVGVLETLVGAWGIYMAAGIAQSGLGMWRVVTVVVLAVMAGGSLWSGILLARRDPRGVSPSILLLVLQSVRLVVPGIAWAVALGWSFTLVLYAGNGVVRDGLEVLVYLGHHDQPAYLAVNLLALIPAAALALWKRAAFLALRRAPRQDPAA